MLSLVARSFLSGLYQVGSLAATKGKGAAKLPQFLELIIDNLRRSISLPNSWQFINSLEW